MSTQYDQEILSNGDHTLKINFSGIKADTAVATDLKLSIYAFSNTGQPKFSETLDFEQIQRLYKHLNQISIIRDHNSQVSGKFVETTPDISAMLNHLTHANPNILKIVLGKLSEEEKINNLINFLSEYEIDKLATLKKHQIFQVEVENLKALLDFEENGNILNEVMNDDRFEPYRAKQPEKIFQNWIEKNHIWIFGVEYVKKHDARKIALYSEGDLLMESMDGFLDLIELKRPMLNIFGGIDTSHKSYYPSQDLSKVLGQCLYYLQKMDDFKIVLEKEHKLKIIRPRIKIIIGRTNNFNDDQLNALRMLNSQLCHIEVISYDMLVKYGEKMIGAYA